jgi:hypothetical protein
MKTCVSAAVQEELIRMEGGTAGWGLLLSGIGAGADADAAALSSPPFIRISAKVVTSCTVTNQFLSAYMKRFELERTY